MTIFILGAGVMQVPAIRIARELGWVVVVADANPNAPGAELADRFLPIDLKDREALEAAAHTLKGSVGLDGVFTAGTDFSTSVAWVAERLGLPGIPYEVALRASDKLLMREALSAAGVPSPRFASVSAGGDPIEAAAAFGFPLVVKPVDNMGARGCRAVRDAAELAVAAAEALRFSRRGCAIIEEYVEGPEFSVDAVVLDGKLRIRGLADRHIAFSPYFIELGHTMPTAYPEEIAREVLRVFHAGVRAIGIMRGAAKGDIKYSPSGGRAVVGEIAARLSGGYMSGWTYPYASGIEVTREALEAAVGLVPAEPRADRGWVSAERAFISIPGRVASLIGDLDVERLPYVKNIFRRSGPGDAVVFPTNNVEKCGNVISQAPDRISATAAAEGAVGALIVRLVPDDAATEAFLRGEGGIANPDGSTWPPQAFTLSPALQAELEAMPEYLRRGAPGETVAVVPFSRATEVSGRDWSGRLFADSAELAVRLGCSRFGAGSGTVLAGRFWRALARGGAQAALYTLDTARAGDRVEGRTGGSP